jgi:hypothetical protein
LCLELLLKFTMFEFNPHTAALRQIRPCVSITEEKRMTWYMTELPGQYRSSGYKSLTSPRVEYRCLAIYDTQKMTCGIFLLEYFRNIEQEANPYSLLYILSSVMTEESGHAEFRSTAYRSYYRSHYYGYSSGYTICRTSSLTASWETVHAEVDRLTARLVTI